jgi:DNA ligase 1
MKPMLASDADLEKLSFPLLASAKLDGIRAIVQGGVVLSRSLKPIRNDYVQSLFKGFEHWDGELIVGDPTSKLCYRDTVSGVMSQDGEPDVKFYAFDHFEHPSTCYMERMKRLKGVINKHVVLHAQHVVTCLDTLLKLEEKMLNLGYEGLILRSQHGHYKFGRSTAKEGLLLKLKRFEDAEAEIVGFEERLQNNNEAKTNALGRTERSSHKANKSGRGDLGALLVRTGEGVSFAIGTGFTDDERAHIWGNQDQFLGRIAKYKHFTVGGYDAPRHPVYLGLRDGSDT